MKWSTLRGRAAAVFVLVVLAVWSYFAMIAP